MLYRSMQQLLGGLSMPSSSGLDYFTSDLGDLGKLSSAVAMLHERDVADVLQQRRSSVLLSYVDNRLGAPEGQLIQGASAMQHEAPGGSHHHTHHHTHHHHGQGEREGAQGETRGAGIMLAWSDERARDRRQGEFSQCL